MHRKMGLRVARCGLYVASCGLWVARCMLRVVGCALRFSGCSMLVARCWLLDTRRLLSAALVLKALPAWERLNRFGVDRLLFIGSLISILRVIIQALNPGEPEITNYNHKLLKPNLK